MKLKKRSDDVYVEPRQKKLKNNKAYRHSDKQNFKQAIGQLKSREKYYDYDHLTEEFE